MRKMSKFLSVFLASIMVVSIVPITVSAEDLITSGICGENITWEFDNETCTLTFTGTGDMYEYYYEDMHGGFYTDDRPWEDIIENDVKHIVIGDGITNISIFAFAYAYALETVTMSSVTCIGEEAFYKAKALLTVTVGNSLKTIGEDAFYKCDKLTYIYYSGTQDEWNDVSIGRHWNDEMDTVKIYTSDYVVYSDYGTYAGLTGSDSVSWAFDANTYTLTVSGDGKMPDDFSSDDIVFGPFYKYEGKRAWDYYKYDTKKVVVGDGITYIGNNSFRFFPNLTEVVIPDSVTKIGNRAFRTCDAITDVYYSGSEEQWNSITVGTDNESLLNATIHYNYCLHEYSLVVTPPTCTEQGYTTHTCKCGDTYIDDYVDETGHNYESVVTEPTCTEQGYTTYTCECGDTYVDDYVDALGHEYKSVITPPNCTEQGYTTYTCECGDSYVGEYIDATGHSYGEWVVTKEATVDAEGEMERECSCGEKEYKVIEKLPAVDDKEEVEDTNKEDVENPDIPNTSSNVASFAYSVFMFIAFACATTSLMFVRKRHYE